VELQHSRPRERTGMMLRDTFPVDELQLSAEEHSIAIRFEQGLSLVDGSSEFPVDVLRTVL
jgi:hypothetical protein